MLVEGIGCVWPCIDVAILQSTALLWRAGNAIGFLPASDLRRWNDLGGVCGLVLVRTDGLPAAEV